MRVLVTGAAGFVGSHLCERLMRDGHEVVGVDAFTSFYAREAKEANLAEAREAPGFELVELDLLAGEGLTDVMNGADAVCHLAGRPGVRGGHPALFETGNVRTTEAVVRSAAAAGVGRMLLTSSSSVYGVADGPVAETAQPRPLSPYGRSKLRAERAAERLARRLGVELVTLRLFTVYGPRQRPDMAFSRYIAAAAGGQSVPLLGDGRQRRDFTYVGDACAAAARALQAGRPGGVYNVSGGRAVALKDAFELLATRLGCRGELRRVPADRREPHSTEADLSRARRELGYEPRVSLEEGLALQVQAAFPAASYA